MYVRTVREKAHSAYTQCTACAMCAWLRLRLAQDGKYTRQGARRKLGTGARWQILGRVTQSWHFLGV